MSEALLEDSIMETMGQLVGQQGSVRRQRGAYAIQAERSRVGGANRRDIGLWMEYASMNEISTVG